MKLTSPKILALLASVFFTLGTLPHVRAKDGDPAYPPTSPAVAQVVEGPEVTIAFNSGQSAKARTLNGAAEQVGLKANEVVDLAVNYGSAKSGTAITAIPLDGGRIVGPTSKLIVDRDGFLSFKFQAGKEVGVYQVALHEGAKEIGLQFWVLDEQNPKRNPPVLRPGN